MILNSATRVADAGSWVRRGAGCILEVATATVPTDASALEAIWAFSSKQSVHVAKVSVQISLFMDFTHRLASMCR